MKHVIFLAAACVAATTASAHPGHGLDGPHGHATDLVGLAWLAVVVLAGLGAWWSGRK